MKSKTVSSILRHVASKLSSEEVAAGSEGTTTAAAPAPKAEAAAADEEAAGAGANGAPSGSEEARLEQLYETIAWPLGKTYGHPYDAFKLALTEPEKVFATLTPQPSAGAVSVLTQTIARRLTPQPIKLRADVELTCYTDAGIEAIRRALREGEGVGTEQVPIKAKLVAPPLYVLTTNATDKVSAEEGLKLTCLHVGNLYFIFLLNR